MSNFTRKVTSSVALLAVVFSAVSPIAGVNAMYTSSVDAANKLATQGVIVDKSANPADYRLGDNITRREVMKVAIQLAACQDVSLNTEYKGEFSDVPSTDWAWKYAETAVDNGFIAANATFSPARNVTKAEALKMIMNAAQVAKADGESNFWAAYVKGGVDAGIVNSFSDYDTAATRGWIFNAAASALEAGTCGTSTDNTTDIIDQLLGSGSTDTTDTTDTTTDTGTTVTTTGGTFTVALSPDTPAAATIPASVSGIPVATYDFTAGDSDVTVTSITLKRRGLSDKNTLTGLAAFSADGRVSKSKNDSENNDTEATLTLTNGFVVKAGQTRALTIVADVNTSGYAASNEFAIELVEVVASTTAQSEGSLVANTLKVGSVDAATLTIDSNGTVSNPKLGETGVDIFKFQLVGDTDEDILLKSITFKSDSSNASDDLANFKLYYGSTQVASTATMDGKYLTFKLGNGYTVAQDKTLKFTVKADVVSGAGDVIGFSVDKKLDVTAEGTTYGYGAAVAFKAPLNEGITLGDNTTTSGTNEGQITLQAGELTIAKVDAPSDKIREDKKDAVLGTLNITNVAGKSIELQKFGVQVAATYVTGAILPGTTVPTTSAGTLSQTQLDLILENFELYNQTTGASYELTGVASVYSDADLSIALASGTNTFLIRTDVKKDVTTTFDKFKFVVTLPSVNSSYFYAVETSDDKAISDISPSSLAWKNLLGTESAATVSVIPLANVTKVQGSTNVVAMQYQVEADNSSALVVTEANVAISASGTQLTNLNSNQVISQVTLHLGDENGTVLDQVSGSNLAAGVATFNGFDAAIAAGAKQQFTVTVSLVDNNAIATTYNPITTKLTGLTVEDDDSNDISVTTQLPKVSARSINVTGVGTLALVQDANNTDNQTDKTVLAGTSKVVFSIDTQATNEAIDVDTIQFTTSGATNAQSAITSASLYLGDTLIATNTNSDITTTGVITFKDLSTLIIPTSSKELKLALNTAGIGYEKVGMYVNNLEVTNITVTKATGVDSGKDLATLPYTVSGLATSSALTDIVPVVVTPSNVQSLSSSSAQAKVKLTIDAGSNTETNSNSTPSIAVSQLKFSTPGASTGATYSLYEDGKSGDAITGTVTSGVVTFNLTGFTNTSTRNISDTKTFVIVPTITTGQTASLTLVKDGVTYDVTLVSGATGITTQLTSEIDLGSRSIN